MFVFFTLEASQPCGKTYRVGLGCHLHLHPNLSSVLTLLSRLF
jgi:hypothetical protein